MEYSFTCTLSNSHWLDYPLFNDNPSRRRGRKPLYSQKAGNINHCWNFRFHNIFIHQHILPKTLAIRTNHLHNNCRSTRCYSTICSNNCKCQKMADNCWISITTIRNSQTLCNHNNIRSPLVQRKIQ